MSQPLVSAILTCYNNADTVCAALRSIWDQAYRNLEILIVDDGSTDGSGEKIKGCAAALAGIDKSKHRPCRYMYQQNKGPSGARNTGISGAQGEFVAFLDADDEWEVQKIAMQVALIQGTEFCLTAGNFWYIHNGRRIPRFLTKKKREIISFNAALFRYYFTPSCVLVKRKSIVEAGMFPEKQHFAEDAYAFTACLRRGRAICIKDFVATKSRKPGSGRALSADYKEMNRWELRNLVRFFKENGNDGAKTNAAVFCAAFVFLFMRRIRRAVIRRLGGDTVD